MKTQNQGSVILDPGLANVSVHLEAWPMLSVVYTHKQLHINNPEQGGPPPRHETARLISSLAEFPQSVSSASNVSL